VGTLTGLSRRTNQRTRWHAARSGVVLGPLLKQ
jgi:hypothetical protein